MLGKWHLGDTPEDLGFEESLYFTANGPYYNRTVLEDGKEITAEGFIEDYIANQAIEFLEEMKDEYDPFFLLYCTQLPHMDDHFDWEVQPETLALYEGKNIQIPVTQRDTLNNKPPYLKTSRSRERGDYYGYQDEDSLKDHILRYYAAITEMDAALGKVFAQLRASGLEENTYVIVMGDNGWFLGEQGINSKVLAYENSIRVPLIINGPGVALGTNNNLVLNIDIAPTLIELAALPLPPNLHGNSLLPLMRKENTEWRKDFLYEAPEPQLGSWPLEAIRTEEWKYIKTYDIENPELAAYEELYNIREDPEEMHNLTHDTFLNNILNDLRSRLARLKEVVQRQ
jgi:arylsulfatase A-like enzyme